MKILMLGWELPPYNTGGLGVACYQLSKALAIAGASIDFAVPYRDKHEDVDFMSVTPALPYWHQELHKQGGAYDSHALAPNSDLRKHQAEYTQAVSKLVASTDYDVIHAHDWLTFEAGMQAKTQTNKPLIAHVHATEFDRAGGGPQGNPIVHDIEYNALTMADRIIAVSQATKDLITRTYAIPANKVEVVHNSVEASSFKPLDDKNLYVYLQSMKAHGYKVVVTVGRLTIQKGLTHLLHAAQLVIRKNPKVLFLLAGTGEQYHELLELSAELGISQNIIFTGQFVRGKAQRDAFAIGDMFIMPSVSEPFGIAPLEAISYGTPALISKQSGVGEVLKNVLKFNYWDQQKMAEQILAMAHYQSLRDELCSRSQNELRRLSWDSVAQKCQAIYQKLRTQGALV
jgi:glycosyltransferase involved in cell wall biosynthesis